jgi:HD-like signal output (HDOD) protein/GGDEF domain-containing protein
MNDPSATLDRLAAHAEQLYSLPAVAMEVLQLTDNPQVDTRALKECIENDPALTGKILRVVNSSLFGLSREISDLNQALALLGTKPLKLLVLGFSLPSGLYAGIEARTLGRYWRRTLTKAVAGRELAERLWHVPGDDAFIAGLLQDVGVLLLLQQLGQPYVQLLQRVLDAGLDLDRLEAEAMGFTHTALSAKMLARWHLPQNLVEAVAADGDGGLLAASPARAALPQILHLAEWIARLLADGQTGALAPLLGLARDYRNLPEDQLHALLGDLEEKVRQLASVLSLQLPEDLQYTDILAEAQRQLAAVAAAAAEELLRGSPDEEEAPAEGPLRGEVAALAEAVSRAAAPRRPAAAHPPHGSPAEPHRAAAAAATAVATADSAAAKTDPGLLGRLGLAVTACRQSRSPLSLLLVELDHADDLLLVLGVEGFDRLRRVLESACQQVDHPCAMCTAYGEAGFALILPKCERRLAVQWADQLSQAMRRLRPARRTGLQPPVTLGVGVATVALPPKNFPTQDLLAAADRCLYGSRASGGGVVKSIEI